MSAVFFQDSIGLITFDTRHDQLGAVRPRIGKGQVIHCLEAYEHGEGLQELTHGGQPERDAGRLFAQDLDDAGDLGLPLRRRRAVLKELSMANNVHDVFIVIVDASFAFELPSVSAGWIEAFDVEIGTHAPDVAPRGAQPAVARHAWQDDVAKRARKQDLDVLRLGVDQMKFDVALLEWVHERRLRRKR